MVKFGNTQISKEFLSTLSKEDFYNFSKGKGYNVDEAYKKVKSYLKVVAKRKLKK